MSTHVPALISDSGLARYLQEIKKFPMLDADEEYMLAQRYKAREDKLAAHKLVTSHLRLVAKIAIGYRGYGLPMSDLIAEGNVGLMQAVKKFDPEKGFRLSTYAMWWIKASIQEFVLKSWSLVKIGTTAAQKKLFFNLRRLKGKIQSADDGSLTPEQVNDIAKRLDVNESDVRSMEQRMLSSDQSLNAIVRRDGESTDEWQDFLTDETPTAEAQLVEEDEYSKRKALLVQAMEKLNDRERDIIQARRLSDDPLTLEDLSYKYKISRERVRQIESRAMEKLEANIKA